MALFQSLRPLDFLGRIIEPSLEPGVPSGFQEGQTVKIIENRFPIAASANTRLSTVRGATNPKLPEANEWHFTNTGSGTVVVTPVFGTNTSHAAYTVPANDSLIVDLGGMDDWKIEETGGANASIVTVVGYQRQ